MKAGAKKENGFRETEIGIIPGDWEVVKLEDVFDIQQGKSLSPKSRQGVSPKPFLRTSNVFWGRIDLSTVDEMDFSPEEVNKLALRNNDLLVCEGGDIGRTAMWENQILLCLYQNHLHRLRTDKESIVPRFYMYWMQAALLYLKLYQGAGNKTTIPNLSRSRLSVFLVPQPSKLEQQKIASVLSRIQQAIEQQDKIIQVTKELKKSLMNKLFTEGLHGEEQKETEIGLIPKSWEVRKLGEFKQLITKGSSPRWQGFNYVDSGIVFVRSQNIGFGGLLLNDLACLSHEFNKKEKKSIIKSEDILINLVGASIGRVAVATPFIEGGNLNQAVAIVRLGSGHFLPNFLMHYFLTKKGQRQIHLNKKEIARANISLQDVNNFLVPKPLINEQKEIATILSKVDIKIQQTESRKQTLQSLFKTMLNQLMTGRVRVKNLDIGVN